MTASRYGMPWILDTKYLFYNKEILEKAGITAPPKTWDELAEQAKIIKDKGLLAHADRLELGAGRSRDLRLHHAGQRLWRRVPRRTASRRSRAAAGSRR